MTTEMHKEFGSWAEDWQSAGDDAVPSVDEIRRQVRHHRWTAVGNIGVGLLFLVVFTAWAVLDPRPVLVAAAVAVWLFVIAAAGFDLWNRRSTWRTVEPSTREFVDLAGRQLSARLRELQFAWGLVAAETACFIPWIAWTVGAREDATLLRYILSYAFLVIMVLGFALILVCVQRHTHRQLNGVRALQRSIADE
jgi:hypothetical protein